MLLRSQYLSYWLLSLWYYTRSRNKRVYVYIELCRKWKYLQNNFINITWKNKLYILQGISFGVFLFLMNMILLLI
jgi:hypothetical protein